jgi:hypothetical protein
LVRACELSLNSSKLRFFESYYVVATTTHNPFSALQKEREREREKYKSFRSQMTTTCCINTTNKRQIELCNSKNKMEQFARYLLHNTEHT